MCQQHRKGHWLTAGWMLILGVLATYIGANGARDWEHISSALRGYLGISLVAGMALLTGGALSLWAGPLKRWTLLTGLVAALVLGVNQSIGLWSKIILCNSPG